MSLCCNLYLAVSPGVGFSVLAQSLAPLLCLAVPELCLAVYVEAEVWGLVAAGVLSVRHCRTGLRCEQACAAEKGVEYKIGGEFERGVSFYGFMSFCCICRLSREKFHLSCVAYV